MTASGVHLRPGARNTQRETATLVGVARRPTAPHPPSCAVLPAGTSCCESCNSSGMMQPPRGGETGSPTRVLLPTAPLTTSWAALQHRAQSRTATLQKQELSDVTVAENYSKSIYQESGAKLFSMVP